MVRSEAPKAARTRGRRRQGEGNGEGVSRPQPTRRSGERRKLPSGVRARPTMGFWCTLNLKTDVLTRKFSIFDIFVTHKNCFSVCHKTSVSNCDLTPLRQINKHNWGVEDIKWGLNPQPSPGNSHTGFAVLLPRDAYA